jgi:hypothetical protein
MNEPSDEIDNRVRINVKRNAKGEWQPDITVSAAVGVDEEELRKAGDAAWLVHKERMAAFKAEYGA